MGLNLRKVDVTRERVLGLIKTATVALTTKEMGRILKVKERSVRAAVSWLILGGFIICAGTIVSQTTPGKYGKRKFKIQVYQWTGKTEEVCKIYTSDYVDRKIVKNNYGDGGLMLQGLMMGMCKINAQIIEKYAPLVELSI